MTEERISHRLHAPRVHGIIFPSCLLPVNVTRGMTPSLHYTSQPPPMTHMPHTRMTVAWISIVIS